MTGSHCGAVIFHKAVDFFEAAFGYRVPAASFKYPDSEDRFFRNLFALAGMSRNTVATGRFSLPEWTDLFFRFVVADVPGEIPAARKTGFPPEPEDATRETRSAYFWLMAALIEDVWEHCTSDRLKYRDQCYLDMVADLDVASVHDFGGGGGRFALALAGRGITVRYSDTNHVKRRFVRFCGRELSLGTLYTGGRPAGDCDLILAIDVLDHVANPDTCLGLLQRRLGGSGFLLFDASFADDGWHSGDENAVARFYDRLARDFTIVRLNMPDVSGMLCAVKPAGRRRGVLAWPDCGALCLPDGVKTIPLDGDDGYLVATGSRMVPPFVVSTTARDFIEAFRAPVETRAIGKLAARFALDKAQGDDLVTDLFERRVLGGYHVRHALEMLELRP